LLYDFRLIRILPGDTMTRLPLKSWSVRFLRLFASSALILAVESSLGKRRMTMPWWEPKGKRIVSLKSKSAVRIIALWAWAKWKISSSDRPRKPSSRTSFTLCP